jgi:hypothetical protein
MTAADYRKVIAKLGLSQARASVLLGVDERTSRRWAAGERTIPPPVARFLHYLLATKTSGDDAIATLNNGA